MLTVSEMSYVGSEEDVLLFALHRSILDFFGIVAKWL